jgi:hypothetical protein
MVHAILIPNFKAHLAGLDLSTTLKHINKTSNTLYKELPKIK